MPANRERVKHEDVIEGILRAMMLAMESRDKDDDA